METIETLLREVPLFDGPRPPTQLELIAGCGSNVHFDDGELLFREGDPADTFYVIRHGSVALETFVPAAAPSRSRRSRPARSSAGRGSSRRTAGTSTRGRSRPSARPPSTAPACAASATPTPARVRR